MNLSTKWLNEFVRPVCTVREFSDALTMSGSKVEGYKNESDAISDVVVGLIISLEKHPNADKLQVCQVDVGGEQPVQIVTGATNVAAGDKIPAALDGACLTGGKVIKSGELRGVKSEGMLCSFGELGLTQSDFPEADPDGIFILNGDCQPGQDICAAIGLDDTVFEFEITSNRPDCLSVIGLARETAVTFSLPLKLHAPQVTEHGGDINELLSVSVENPELCRRYCARVVKNVKIKPSPRWMRERLRASGVRPINNIVDITNYVMLEYGQPMHAFDIRFVEGAQINVRTAKPGESIVTLDGVGHALSENMLVIADGKKPVAVAGVMGGEHSGVMDETATIVFESACFNGGSVRTTAKALGMRTDSSARFEKGLDAAQCMPALERACELVELTGAGETVSGCIDRDYSDKTPNVIDFDPAWINGFLGTDIPANRMSEIMTALEFKVDGGRVFVPPFRIDVEHKADIAEEIARIYGYGNIPVTEIRGSAQGKLTDLQKFRRKIAGILTGCGQNEIVTYSFISPKYYDKILVPEGSALRDCVTISNPLGEDTSVMRTTALPCMLEALSRNFNNRNLSAKLFEIATEYRKTDDEQLPVEHQTLYIGMYGQGLDYYSLKGVVEEVLDGLSVPGCEYVPCKSEEAFHPGRCAQLLKDGKSIGVLGEMHPLVRENYEIDMKVCVASLCMESLFELSDSEKTYAPLPKFPASGRDLALLCDDDIPVAELEKAIRAASGDILETVTLFDVYQGAQIPQGKKSVAYALSFRAGDRTLTDKEIDGTLQLIFNALEEKGATLRV